ncbi:hypothetical protein AAHD62_14555 [Enterobacter hormaechei]
MSVSKQKPIENNSEKIEAAEPKQKKCFAIMPIADHPDYPQGHFTRVYNHIIKPACEAAGYKVIRADDAKASHMIMFDILKNIIECDMAICDLSSKNANVFYELGLRQAFNKKTILITDGLTNTPFDITGFRYVKYSESLRVDTVEQDILEITAMLKETESAGEDDINSIVNLLRIQPAHLNPIQLTDHESVLYKLIKNLDAKVSKISSENRKVTWGGNAITFAKDKSNNDFQAYFKGRSFEDIFRQYDIKNHNVIFMEGGTLIGSFVGENESNQLVFALNDLEYVFPNTLSYRKAITVA